MLAILAIAARPRLLRFSPDAIFGFRIVTGVLLVARRRWFFARPLMRKVSDEQVALYLEEHEPSLEATIITAMAEPGDRAAVAGAGAAADRDARSSACTPSRTARRIEREPLRKLQHGRRRGVARWPC